MSPSPIYSYQRWRGFGIPISYNFVETRCCLTLRVSYSLSSRTDHFLLQLLSMSVLLPCARLTLPHVRRRSIFGRPAVYTSTALTGVHCGSCSLPAGRPPAQTTPPRPATPACTPRPGDELVRIVWGHCRPYAPAGRLVPGPRLSDLGRRVSLLA